MTPAQQAKAAKEFAEFWQSKEGYEKGQSQLFWTTLLNQVFGIEHPEQFIIFEDQVQLEHTSFIDARIPSTKVMIEQKSLGKDLGAPIKQSDGSFLNPFQQAKRYAADMPYSQRPRWIVTCNFAEFWVYDMEQPNGEPQKILLRDLEKEYYRLSFLVDSGNAHLKREMEVSVKAGQLVGKIYDLLLKQYLDPDAPETLRSLNILCVRMVFCLYAEDAHLFGKKTAFHDYLAQYPAKDMRRALIDLFAVLDTPIAERDPYMDEVLKAFPYVNGGLFSHDAQLQIPQFTEELKELILTNASDDFDWSEISPTIFGAVFESTLNPETRRSGGMHYTSIENIHKVIDPLFLDGLREELADIKLIAQEKQQRARLDAFQDKLASLTFFDPACGSGNFLTESYVSLRRLENEVIAMRNKGQAVIGDFANPVKVDIHQFYGIEINDFAVSVATTALWIAEQQMLQETEKIASFHLSTLPLKAYHNIREGNALRIDWSEVIAPEKLNYIMGNPPFVGAMWMKGEKREDVALVFPECEKVGEIDYVSGWYAKAAKFISGTRIRCAFVSTNSICQGGQVSLVWKPLLTKLGVKIDFAYTTFRWDSESNLKAKVHCIIVGFSTKETPSDKFIITPTGRIIAKHINGYLTDAEDVFIDATRQQICGMPPMHMGVMARDGGFLILSDDEYREYCEKEPQGAKFIRRYMMGKEFINNIPRYCFWLVDAEPGDIRKCPMLLKRMEGVREARLSSPAKETRAFADTPGLFCQLAQPTKNFIAFPSVSSEQRRYVPIGFMSPDVIVGNKLYVIEDVGLFHFGVLTSNVHNAWMRAVCGRLEMRYNYSNTIVYNNFPWCSPTEEQRNRIEKTAKAILDARANHPNSSLADLYDELAMPADLRKAHQENDRAVMAAYGFSTKISESECVAELFKMYQELTK